MRKKVKPSSRESDERILKALMLRFEGRTTNEIEARLGYGRGVQSRDFAAVIAADRATPDLSSLPSATVAQAYPWA